MRNEVREGVVKNEGRKEGMQIIVLIVGCIIISGAGHIGSIINIHYIS